MSVGVAVDGNQGVAGNVGDVVLVSWYMDRAPPVTPVPLVGGSGGLQLGCRGLSVSCTNEAFPPQCVACWQCSVASAAGSVLTSMDRCESTAALSRLTPPVWLSD